MSGLKELERLEAEIAAKAYSDLCRRQKRFDKTLKYASFFLGLAGLSMIAALCYFILLWLS